MGESQSISKLPEDATAYRRTFTSFPSGRSAFKAILQDLDWPQGRVLLLPAYIGWSSREGSGVFDPVSETKTPFVFYKMTDTLIVDEHDLAQRLKEHPGAVVLLIHYFGRVDPNYAAIVKLVQQFGGELIEDQAHAMLTDLVGGQSGRNGLHSFYSFHKILPVQGGGARVFNGMGPGETALLPQLQSWDLHAIAQARVRNFSAIAQLLAPHRDLAEPIWPRLSEGEVPQTFPLKLITQDGDRALRDLVYDRMNKLGFGVVSLYHTMISELSPSQYPDSFTLANCILNLPVHQDIQPGDLAPMVEALVFELRSLGKNRG